MAFVQFVLSFLVSGDNTLIGQVLEFKGSVEFNQNLYSILTVSVYAMLV